MARKEASKKNVGGRPPAGPAGEKVGAYPHQIAARVDGETYHLLDTIQHQTRRSYREVLTNALALYLKQEVDRDTRASIQSATAAARRHCPKCAAR
jgi:hypothetical protein